MISFFIDFNLMLYESYFMIVRKKLLIQISITTHLIQISVTLDKEFCICYPENDKFESCIIDRYTLCDRWVYYTPRQMSYDKNPYLSCGMLDYSEQ